MKASTRKVRTLVGPHQHRVRRSDRLRARKLVDTLTDLIETPFDAESFAIVCGRRRGRAIRVVTSREMFDTADGDEMPRSCLVTGLAITYRSGDITILVRDSLVGVHRDHVILHELAHVLFEHHSSSPLDMTDRQVHSLFGDLFAPDAVRQALAGRPHRRNGLTTDQEREAEAFADEILTRTQSGISNSRRSIARKYGFIRP